MPRRNNNSITDFQFAQYNPGVMQFQAFTPQSNLGDFAANQIEKYQAASDKADEANNATKLTIGKIKSELYDDPSNAAFIEQKEKELNNVVQPLIDQGLYYDARKKATEFASDLAANSELNGRLKASESKREFDKLIDSRNDINATQKAYLKAINGFDYTENSPWNPKVSAQSSYDMNTFAATVDKLLSEERKTWGSNADKNGKYSDTTTSESYQKKTVERFRALANEQLNDPVLRAQLHQAASAGLWELEQLDERIKEVGENSEEGQRLMAERDFKEKPYKNKNGVRISLNSQTELDDFVIRYAGAQNGLWDYMSYDWRSSNTEIKDPNNNGSGSSLSQQEQQDIKKYYSEQGHMEEYGGKHQSHIPAPFGTTGLE